MNRGAIVTVVICALGGVLIAINSLTTPGRLSIEAQLERWIADGDASSRFESEFAVIASRFTVGTRFEGRVNLGLPPKQDYVNLYAVSRTALARTYPQLVCNCAYIGELQAIVCDAEFVHDFRNLLSIPESELDEADAVLEAGGGAGLARMMSSQRSQFLSHWLLGHELGHVVLEHGNGALRAGPSPRDAGDSDGVVDTTSWGLELEREADLFMASRFDDDAMLQVGSWMTLSQLTTTLYTRRIDESGQDSLIRALEEEGIDPTFGTAVPVDVEANPARHPPWIVRAVELADHMIEAYPQLVDNTGYFQRVRNQLNPIRTGAPRDWICAEAFNRAAPPADTAYSHERDVREIRRLLIHAHSDAGLVRAERLRAITKTSYGDSGSVGILGELVFAEALIEAEQYERAREVLAGATSHTDTIRAHLATQLQYTFTRSLLASRLGQSVVDDPETEVEFNNIESLARDQYDGTQSQGTLSAYYFAMWRLAIALRGIQDEWTARFLSFVRSQSLNPLETEDVARVWEREILALESSVDVPEEVVLNERAALVDFLASEGRRLDAIRVGLDLVGDLDRWGESPLPVRRYYRSLLARLLVRLGASDEAIVLANEAVEIQDSIVRLALADAPEAVDDVRETFAILLNNLGFDLLADQRNAEAVPHLRRALSIQEQLGRSEVELATVHHNLAQAITGVRTTAEAVTLASEALRMRRVLEVPPEAILNSQAVYAGALYGSGDLDAAQREMSEYFAEWRRLEDFNLSAAGLVLLINGETIDLVAITGEDLQPLAGSPLTTVRSRANRGLSEVASAIFKEGR